ncbi:MAG: hypothetical protein C4321_03445 [Chloroflexota bacterium]
MHNSERKPIAATINLMIAVFGFTICDWLMVLDIIQHRVRFETGLCFTLSATMLLTAVHIFVVFSSNAKKD